MELKNSTILITGGTSGIGFEFASKLLALGNTVIVTGRNQAKLDQAKEHLPKVQIFQSDVSDPASIQNLYEQVIKQFPALNIIINNAGEMRKINLNDTSVNLQNITREIDINLSGPIRMVQEFLPHLKTKENAAIVNVTSGIALVPFPLSPIYSAAKSGLRFYTKSLRVQLNKTNIKVFELVAPAINTPLNDKFRNVDGFNPKTLMEPGKLVQVGIKGMMKDKFEIYPGLAGVMLFMSRLAPRVIFSQMAKIAEKSIAANNAGKASYATAI